MELTLEMISMGLVVMTLNVLDSITTSLCLTQYPDKELRGEGNPIQRSLMLKSKVLAEVVKHGVCFICVVYSVALSSLSLLTFLSLTLGLTVLNNTFVVVSRAITKRKIISPIMKLMTLLRLPKKYSYVIAMVIITSLSLFICYIIFGYQGFFSV